MHAPVKDPAAKGAAAERPAPRVEVEDVKSTKAQKQDPLYADHVKVYPKRVAGTFRTLKWWILGVCLAIYYLTPWIRWDRGPGTPDQAVLMDLDGRRGYFFFIEIWPQEVYYFTGLLVLGALAIFLATSLAGRLWCGYACPQTVWTDLFMKVEGDRNARIKLDKGPLTVSKAWKKTFKHTLWLLIAAATGGAWIMYFQDAPTLAADFFVGEATSGSYFFFALFTATTYLLAGWAREQVCTYMCPWPRFQSAMYDDDTLVVTYQEWRGEPRGRHRKGESWEGRGHCVDCNQCVAVCPTGIDIRDGQQLECIGCALCVDACNSVMDKLDLPRGLIKHDTARNAQLRGEGKPLRYRLIRPRTMIYGGLLIAVAAAMLWSLAARATIEFNVLHERAPLFVQLSDGGVRNSYTIKIANMEREVRTFAFEVEGLPAGADMTIVGEEYEAGPVALLSAHPDAVTSYRVHIELPDGALEGSAMPLEFRLSDMTTDESATAETVFRGPEQ